MTASRVGALKIKLRIPAELEATSAQLKHTVERELMTHVLDELERLLHAELGSRVVIRIRRLALSWRLDAAELVRPETVMRLARDLSRGVLDDLSRASQRERLRPRPETIAAFVDDDHALAALLADAADGLPTHWVHAGLTADQAWQRASAAGTATLAAVVTWLVRLERLEAAVSIAPAAVLAVLDSTVPAAAPAVALVRARRGETAGRRAPPAVTEREVAAPRDAKAAPPVIHDEAAAGTSERRIDAPAPGEQRPASVDPAPLPTAHEAASPVVLDEISASTRAAGLFYLIGRALEIELAERLWAAGLPEGDVLAHVAATLLGDLDDPAWRWFGGTFDRSPAMPPVPAWAVTELCDGVQLALGQRLVRFGVTLTPAVLGARLDHLAGGLAPPFPLDPALARVVTRGAAAIACITCARLGISPSIAAVREVCARPGTLVRLPGELRVVIAMQHFDLDHRRAGLDQDPGYVPWLRRTVRIELIGGAEL